MSQTIPIQLQPIPAPVSIRATDINQLLTIICQYVSGSISNNVSFFDSGPVTPSQMTSLVFLNTTQGVFYIWSSTLGAYRAMTQFQPGDTKSTFVAGDSPQIGWIMCDGRLISSIQGISTTQLNVLEQLFGIGGSLPNLSVPQLSGLPATGAFSSIPITDITPPAGQIGGLPFSTDYNQTEEQNLASNTETLRGSAQALKTSVSSINTVAQQLLTALSGSTTAPLYVNVFIGYP